MSNSNPSNLPFKRLTNITVKLTHFISPNYYIDTCWIDISIDTHKTFINKLVISETDIEFTIIGDDLEIIPDQPNK